MVTNQEPLDKKALIAKLFEEHYEQLSRYCYFFTKNRYDVEDFVSETFIKAYDHLDSFKGDRYLPWLYRIARNLIYDKFRKYENKVVINQFDYEEYYEDSKQNVEEENIRKDEFNHVMEMMDLLSSDQKEAIVLRYIHEMEFNEIAEIMGKSENAVRLNISKGLKNLRNYGRK